MRLAIAPPAALLLLGAAAACGGEEEGSADSSPLDGIAWVLVSGVDVEGWEDVAPSATFADVMVTSSTSCNRFMGS